MSSADRARIEHMQMLRMIRFYAKQKLRPFNYIRKMPKLNEALSVCDKVFSSRFGIRQLEFEELHTMIESKIRHNHKKFRNNIGSRERLAIFLMFLSGDKTIEEITETYKVTWQIVSVIIKQMSNTIVNCLTPLVMPPPTKEMWEKNARDFKTKHDMPNCIGALEGKIIHLDGQRIVFLAIIDADAKFVMVDVGNYRPNPLRGNVMDKSRMAQQFLKKKMFVPADKPFVANSKPVPFMLVASALFPPTPYMMIKYNKAQCDQNELNVLFNYRVSRAKLIANKALLTMRANWQVFQGNLQVRPAMVETIIKCCCCLHNFFGVRHIKPERNLDGDYPFAISPGRINALLKLIPEDSKDIRDQYKKYFLSPEGQVPWQWNNILT